MHLVSHKNILLQWWNHSTLSQWATFVRTYSVRNANKRRRKLLMHLKNISNALARFNSFTFDLRFVMRTRLWVSLFLFVCLFLYFYSFFRKSFSSWILDAEKWLMNEICINMQQQKLEQIRFDVVITNVYDVALWVIFVDD